MSAPATSAVEATATAVADFIDRLLSAAQLTAVEAVAATELTVSQLRMLFVLARGKACPVHEVADEVGLSLPAAGRAADRLVALGFVDRREDAQDRRVKRLSLTGSGHDLLTEQFRVHSHSVRAPLQAIPEDVRDRLHQAVAAAAAYLPPPMVHHA